MGKVILDMAMSLDGFATGNTGECLYPISEMRGTPEFRAIVKQAGAVAMDRQFYEMYKGDFSGFMYQAPVFVFTGNVPAGLAKDANEKLRFTFIASSIEETIRRAQTAARLKNVMVLGWTGFAQECLHRRLIDEIIIRLLPLLVGKGERLLENLGETGARLAPIDAELISNRCDLRFWVAK